MRIMAYVDDVIQILFFLLNWKSQYGKDALIEYWFAMILSNLSEDREKTNCLLDHLIEYYQCKLKVSSSHDYSYVQKMLYMLHSLQKPIMKTHWYDFSVN